jgi:hypothetical protein
METAGLLMACQRCGWVPPVKVQPQDDGIMARMTQLEARVRELEERERSRAPARAAVLLGGNVG